MKTLQEHLGNYAAYHRDRRNIATHFVGVPMIVFGVATLLSRPSWPIAGYALSPAAVAILLSSLFYLSLDLRYALVLGPLFGLAGFGGAHLAAGSTGVWLAAGLGSFVVGWVIQFVGHAWEGRKPAFVDDLIGLLVGPLFVLAEAGFALGLRLEVREEIERRAGPTRVGRSAVAA